MSTASAQYLEEVTAAATRAWPACRSLERYAEAVARRLELAAGGAAACAHAGDLVLAEACVAGDEEALATFDAAFRPVVTSVARRVPGEDAEDLIQRVWERLLVGGADGPRLREYRGRGALGGFVRVVASRAAHRDSRPTAPIEAAEAVLQGAPELPYLKHRSGREVTRAFEAALDTLSCDERLLLKQRFIDGVDLPGLATLQKVDRATVVRRLAVARGQVLRLVKAELEPTLKYAGVRWSSFWRSVRSVVSVPDLARATEDRTR